MQTTNIRYDRPIPSMVKRGKYPHCVIDVGGSYEVADPDKHYARVIAWKHAKATGKQFTARTIDGRMYIWRVS